MRRPYAVSCGASGRETIAGGRPSEAPQYWAFISYSHADTAAARWLQLAIESYRVPQRLVGRQTTAGVVPRHARPLFRDRDELKAVADLNASVRQAIDGAGDLVVMCSPQAAASEWVNREMRACKPRHRESRLFRYHRIDGAWRADALAALGCGAVDVRRVRRIDAVDQTDALGRIGAALAARQLPRLLDSLPPPRR